MENSVKVLIVEDNENIRLGLKMLIDGTPDFSCVGDYSNCEDMLKEVESLKPDIVLMDIDLPGMSGIEGIKQVRKIFPEIRILVLTIYDESETVFKALCAGACGYMVKKTPPAQLLDAIQDAYKGGAPMSSHIARKVVDFFQQRETIIPQATDVNLTPREKEVLRGLVEGNNYKAIADSLFISVETVRFHFRNIYKKLHVHSQSEAVAKAIKQGLI
ncbi:MAG: response regulator transcription factor [Melioribacteraceae bacterium]|nr:response regulator transcription factor [Melioribacteraceae bacterium]MCO6472111.1 response regulator transcription factor [Melioribacteraceae bacterium]MDD3559048.1 response regulator transcription factor [Melioribacteraceae bacterium]